MRPLLVKPGGALAPSAPPAPTPMTWGLGYARQLFICIPTIDINTRLARDHICGQSFLNGAILGAMCAILRCAYREVEYIIGNGGLIVSYPDPRHSSGWITSPLREAVM